jgi:hypothetical protein
MRVHPDRATSGDLQTFLAVKAAYEWIVAHPRVAEPGDRPPATRVARSVAARVRRAPSSGARLAPAPIPRSSWPGGRWYWEGRDGRGSGR